MTSIHRFATRLLDEFSQLSLSEEGLSDYLDKSVSLFYENLLSYVTEQISEMDTFLVQHRELREDWQVVKGPVERTLETKLGTLRYSRRYYRHQTSGVRSHLLDAHLGVQKYARVEDGLLAALGSLACSRSYAQAAQEASGGRVSRMTVQKAIRTLEPPELPAQEPRRVCRELHLQADEDYVHLQHPKGKKKTAQVRLVALHEPKTQVGARRFELTHRELMGSVGERPEAFWWRVLDRIDAVYDWEQIERIYLHGDGAGWIRKGLEILPGSVFVLDGFHLERAIRSLCAGNAGLASRIRACLYPFDEKALQEEVQMLLESAVCSSEKAADTLNYFSRQREGIENHYALEHGGSCAEGLVSHMLSKRLSRDPMGWSMKSLQRLSDLRIYQLNGGVIDRRLLPSFKPVFVTEPEAWKEAIGKQEATRKKGLEDWRVGIPGTENTGSALGAWMKGIRQGGFVS